MMRAICSQSLFFNEQQEQFAHGCSFIREILSKKMKSERVNSQPWICLYYHPHFLPSDWSSRVKLVKRSIVENAMLSLEELVKLSFKVVRLLLIYCSRNVRLFNVSFFFKYSKVCRLNTWRLIELQEASIKSKIL